MNAARVNEEKEMKANEMGNRVVRIETIIEHINFMLERIDKRFDAIEERLDKNDVKIESIRKEGWAQMRWILTFLIALCASPFITNIIQYFHSMSQ